MRRKLEENQRVSNKKLKEQHHYGHQCCLLDLNYSSNLLSTKIADIPQKLKYETILAPIFEYCFGTSDQNRVWEEFTEEEKAYYCENGEFFDETELDNSIKLKIDWIRDKTFLYNHIFNLTELKVAILESKLGLRNNRKFILNCFTYFDEKINFYPTEELRNDRELIMEIVKEKGLNLKYASDKLRSDKEIVMEAVKRNGAALQFASAEFKDDKEIVMIALESVDSYRYVSKRLSNHTDVVLKTLLKTLQRKCTEIHDTVYSVPQRKLYEIFNNDRELLLKISHFNDNPTLEFASSELRNDKEFVLKVIQQTPDAFRYASDELKNDREFVKESVKIDGRCLNIVSKEFLDDREIVELALKSYPSAISYISDRFRNDIEFISNSIGKGGFHELPREFSNDREIVLESTKLAARNFRAASDELKNDREFILQVLKHSAMVWIVLDRQYRDDEEIIIQASQTIFKLPVYNLISPRLKNDRELLKKCGGIFSSFPRKYQIDREIVMECLKTNPNDVLTYAFPLIATDRVLAMRIVKRNGLLLGEMPFKYRNDREIVSFAIQQNKEAFKYASDELQKELNI